MDWAAHFQKRSADFGADTAASPLAPLNHVSIVEQVIAGVVVLIIGGLSYLVFRGEEAEIRYLRSELAKKDSK